MATTGKRLRRTGMVKEGKEERSNTGAKMSTKRQSTAPTPTIKTTL